MIQTLKYKKVFVAALVAAAATLFGCTQDETVQERSQQPIGFNVVVNQAKTTRSISSLNSSNLSKFDIWAYRADQTNSDPVMGVDAQTGYQISKTSKFGIIAELQDPANGIWGYTDRYQVTYWPNDGTQQLAFYAFAPTTVGNTVPNLTHHITKADHAFDYIAAEGDNYSHSDQRDLIVAGKTVNLTDIKQQTASAWMTVNLTFKHALSQIMFDAKLAPNHPDFRVVIHSIAICNISRQGTCTIGSTDGTPTWTNTTTKTRDAYTVVTGTPGTGITLYSSDGTDGAAADAVALSNGTAANNSDNLMLIPQTLTAWDVSGTPLKVDNENQTGSYLKIRCDITQKGFNLLKEQYVYVPFGNGSGVHDTWDGTWVPGKSYTYHLLFGLGRNSDGLVNSEDITYTVSVADTWTTPVESSIPL